MEDAAQVRLEDGIPLIARHLRKRTVAGDPGVVDEHVDLPEALDDAGDRRLYGVRILDVAAEGKRLSPGNSNLGGDLLCRLGVAGIANRHGCAMPAEFESNRPADAARSAGDEAGLACQISHCRYLLQLG